MFPIPHSPFPIPHSPFPVPPTIHMTNLPQLPADLLTPEEAVQVDASLMSSQEKFATRLAIYALRSLDRIARETRKPIDSITPEEIGTWIASDLTRQGQIEIDSSFASFFTHLILSSMRPLQQAARDAEVEIEQLSVPQVITWFEGEAARALGKNTQSE